MASSNEWAFDVAKHAVTYHADSIGFVADQKQWYADRVNGTLPDGGRAVILPKGVGTENATRYRRWVTLPAGHWAAMTARPLNWRPFVLMIGLLPDGQPWWSTLYDEQLLAQTRDHSENMGGFYRFDPHLVEMAVVSDWDKDEPFTLTGPRDPLSIETVWRCPKCGLLTDHDIDDATFDNCPVCGDGTPAFAYTRSYPPLTAGR